MKSMQAFLILHTLIQVLLINPTVASFGTGLTRPLALTMKPRHLEALRPLLWKLS